MGYYSEVAISVLEKDFNKFVLSLDRNGKDKTVIDLLRYGTIEKTGKVVTIYWNEIKWHEGDYDIDRIMDWVEELADEGSVAKFIRIGEDYDDIIVREYYNECEDEDTIAVLESIYTVKYISKPENAEKIDIEGVDNND